jgi:hypothetical protein
VLKAVSVEPIATKDIAIAVMGGSASIASILLVFVGFVFTKAEDLPAQTDDAIINRYRRSAKLGLIPLVEQVLVILASYLWLFHPDSQILLCVWNVGFVAGLLLFIGYSAYITLRL